MARKLLKFIGVIAGLIVLIYVCASLVLKTWNPLEYIDKYKSAQAEQQESTEPATPTEPDEPSKPTEPNTPTQPTTPTDPEKPTESTDKITGQYKIFHTIQWADSMSSTGPDGYTAPEYSSNAISADEGVTITYKFESTDSRVSIKDMQLYVLGGDYGIYSLGNAVEGSLAMPQGGVLINAVLSYTDSDGNLVDGVSENERHFISAADNAVTLARVKPSGLNAAMRDADVCYSKLNEYEKSHDAVKETLRAYLIIADKSKDCTLTDEDTYEAEAIIQPWYDKIFNPVELEPWNSMSK